jgi:hypothetical protein
MSDLTTFEFDGDSIREVDGLFSVYDIIRVIGGQKSERAVWKRISNDYPDIVAKCNSVKFLRKDGKKANLPSPACNRQVALEIIGLLPGQVGKKYREESAKLFCRYVDADITLADDIIQRTTNNVDLKWLQTRIEGKVIRNQFTDELKSRGVTGYGYASNTDAINVALFDLTAKQIKKIRDVKQTRDGLSGIELAALQLAEYKAIDVMQKQNARGNEKTTECSRKAGHLVRKVIDA